SGACILVRVGEIRTFSGFCDSRVLHMPQSNELHLPDRKPFSKSIQANLIAGVLTVIPLIVVWFVLDFIFTFLEAVGAPVAAGLTMFITDRMPNAASLLEDRAFRWLVAVIM